MTRSCVVRGVVSFGLGSDTGLIQFVLRVLRETDVLE